MPVRIQVGRPDVLMCSGCRTACVGLGIYVVERREVAAPVIEERRRAHWVARGIPAVDRTGWLFSR
jgi:hypothetical protein